MSNKNVTLKEKVNGVVGDVLLPKTTTTNVYDPAKEQALSQTLENTPDKAALGYPAFSTLANYVTGDKVYYNNKVYRFVQNHSAGEWNALHVEEWSAKDDIDAINEKIPADASSENPLTDKAYVDNGIATASATFRGTYNLVTDLELELTATHTQVATALAAEISTADKNDYAFVQIPTSAETPTEIASIDRYKNTGSAWSYEYSINNSGFTTAQWAAINSGVTATKVAKLDALPTAAEMQDTLATKADLETKANKDGYYSQMTVGSAENLVGQTVDSEAYLIRPTGGAENEVANGVASVLGMEGNSAVWNQLVQNGDFSNGTAGWMVNYGTMSVNDDILTIIKTGTDGGGDCHKNPSIHIDSTHKYYISAFAKVNTENTGAYFGFLRSNGTTDSNTVFGTASSSFVKLGGVAQPTSNTDYLSVRCGIGSTPINSSVSFTNIYCIDLTLLGIDNLTTVAQVEAWLAQHVGTKPYYAYNAGTILSAQTLGIKTYGQNLLNPTTRQARLIPYEWEENSNVYTIKNVPSGATATFTPDATGVAESITITNNEFDITNYGSGILELSAATANTYVCMKWDEQKDNDVVPYEDHTYDFDVRKVYGKVSGAGEYVQCFPNGMKNYGSVHDILSANEAKRYIERINLGNLSWESGSYYGPYWITRTTIPNLKSVPDIYTLPYWKNNKYDRCKANSSDVIAADKVFFQSSNGKISVKDTTNLPTSLSEQSVKQYLANIEFDYLLATPITYTDLIYRDGGIDRPLADVLMNIEVNNWSMEEQLMTPYDNGNPTSVPATISTKYGMDAVEAIDTLQKTCYFADDVKANLQALLTCINTNCAETLGGTFSVSDTATDKVFAFSFTPNTEPDVEPTNEGE